MRYMFSMWCETSNAYEVINMENQNHLFEQRICINETVKNQYFLSTFVIAVTLYTCDGFQQVYIKKNHNHSSVCVRMRVSV